MSLTISPCSNFPPLWDRKRASTSLEVCGKYYGHIHTATASKQQHPKSLIRIKNHGALCGFYLFILKKLHTYLHCLKLKPLTQDWSHCHWLPSALSAERDEESCTEIVTSPFFHAQWYNLILAVQSHCQALFFFGVASVWFGFFSPSL